MSFSDLVLVVSVVLLAHSIMKYRRQDPASVSPMSWKLISYADSKNTSGNMQLYDALLSRLEKFTSDPITSISDEVLSRVPTSLSSYFGINYL